MAPKNDDIHKNHRQRMSDRFAENRFDGFAEHEILEYMLFFVIPRIDVNPLAHRLIDHFGSLAKVLEASEHELKQVAGVGEKTARFLVMVMQAGCVYQRSNAAPPKVFTSLEEIANFVVPLFHGANTELVYALFLDDRNSLIQHKRMAEGSANEAAFSKKALVQAAVRLGATQVVLAHNHPGGVALPSAGDLQLTRQLNTMLQTLGINLLDHIIVDGEGDCMSMQQTKRME